MRLWRNAAFELLTLKTDANIVKKLQYLPAFPMNIFSSFPSHIIKISRPKTSVNKLFFRKVVFYSFFRQIVQNVLKG